MKIPYGRQEITPDDIAAVVSVLESDFLTQGPKVGDFEAAVGTMVGPHMALPSIVRHQPCILPALHSEWQEVTSCGPHL